MSREPPQEVPTVNYAGHWNRLLWGSRRGSRGTSGYANAHRGASISYSHGKFEQMRGRKPLVCKSFCCGVKDFIKPGQSSSSKTTPSASLKWQQHSFSGAILTQPLLSSPRPCSKSTRNRIWWLPKPNLIPSRQQLRAHHDLRRYGRQQLERCSSASRSLLMQRWQRGDPNLDILGKCTPSSTKKEASSSEPHL